MEKPLDGIRVLDFSQAYAAPFCSMLLADLGAEVVKLEGPNGDYTRGSPPFTKSGMSVQFAVHNRSKKAITLNLRTDRGKELFRQLIKLFDVFVENWRPGVTTRLGCDYATVSKINPRLVMLSISGFGQTGPYAQFAGNASVINAMGGLLDVTRDSESVPVRIGAALPDYIAGIYGALSVVTALHRRQQTGEGEYIDLSLWEGLVSTMASHISQYWSLGEAPKFIGNHNPNFAADGIFRAKDGYIFISAGPDNQWSRLCRALDRDDLLEDPRLKTAAGRVANRSIVDSAVARWTEERTVNETVEALRATGVNCGPVRTVPELVGDPQLLARDFFREIGQDDANKLVALMPPFKFLRIPEAQPTPPPLLGEHNQQVYGGWLGMGEQELARLKEQGVV